MIGWWIAAGPLAQIAEAAEREDFQSGHGSWELVGAARIRRGVLELPAPGHGFWGVPPIGDAEIGLRLRAEAGVAEIVLHATGEPPQVREYAVHLGPEELVLVRRAQGREERLARSAEGLRPGWHEVGISVRGGRIEVRVDGRPRLSAADTAPLPAGGGLALGCITGQRVEFDDVVLERGGGAVTVAAEEVRELEVLSLPDGPVLEPLVASAPVMVPVTELQRALVWERTGGPLGGLGYDIRLARLPGGRPVDRMYVTDSWAGVFRSLDGGQHWEPSVDGIHARIGATWEAIPVFSLTVDPHDRDIVWAGTKDSLGVYRSIDGGQHWEWRVTGIAERFGITFRGFTVDPRSSDRVYAAAEVSAAHWSANPAAAVGKNFIQTMGVVYVTDDAGLHWRELWRGDDLARYVLVNPDNPDKIYISTGIFDREAANSTSTTPGGIGVIRTTNGGRSWSGANTGLGNLFVGSLFMHPTDPDTLLAAAGNNAWNGGGGVYLTTDGGDRWSLVLPAPSSSEVFTAVEIAVDPLDGRTTAYAGSQRAIYRSTDGGFTWTRRTSGDRWGPPGVTAGWPIDLQADPDDPERLFANAYGGGCFLSTDGGATWTDASRGYTGAQVRGVAVHPTDPDTVYAGSRSGIFVSADRGGAWSGLVEPPVIGLDWPTVGISPHPPHTLLSASLWTTLLLRREGRSWREAADLKKLIPGLPPQQRLAWRAIGFAPSDPGRVYVGVGGLTSFGQFADDIAGAGVFRSNDGGVSFAQANDALSSDAHVRDLAVHPRSADVVYAATANHGVIRSDDGGQHWTLDNQGLHAQNSPPPVATSIAALPGGRLLVGVRNSGLFVREPGAAGWTQVPSIDPTASVTDIVVDPSDPDVVYASDRKNGVYRSGDGGLGWTHISLGLDMHEINALAVAGDGSVVYAATEGVGVYRLTP